MTAASGAGTYICVELPHKAGEVVVLEGTGQQISGELSWLPHNETAACIQHFSLDLVNIGVKP